MNHTSLCPQFISHLPPLAWLAVIRSEPSEIAVIHGRSVYATTDLIAEGAWDGSLNVHGFCEASWMAGSGIAVGDDITVRTPSHPLERLWSMRDGATTRISNSLPLLLASTGNELPPSLIHLEADLLSFLLGTGHDRTITLPSGVRIHQHSSTYLTFDRQGIFAARKLPRVSADAFTDFSHYTRHLADSSLSVCANAADPRRRRTYRALATASRGYDSPACAVLAKTAGATRVITYRDARGVAEATADSGEQIADLLNLKPLTFSRTQYLQGDGRAEVEGLAAGGGGEDLVLTPAREEIRGSILFTGFLGDTVWGLGTDTDASARGMIRFPGGASLGEFRIHSDFVHLPLPVLDLREHRRLHAISISREMAHWRLGTDYDRPIPRRIAEEAGIPRDAFGQKKMAITAPLYYDTAPAALMSPLAEESFQHYIEANRAAVMSALTAYEAGRRRRAPLRALIERLAWRADQWPVGAELRLALRTTLADRWRRAPAASLFLPHWAINTLTREYRDILTEVEL